MRVLFVLDGSTRCHVSPYTPSTVALAPGPFISLCAGLFIVSQALSQMCTATAPPAWLHMLCCATPSSLLLILLLFMCTSYREQLSKNILAPLNATGTRIRRSGGEAIAKGRGGGGVRQSRMLTLYKLKESRLGHSTVSTHLSPFLSDVSLLFSLTLQPFFLLPFFSLKLQDTRRIKYK